MGRGKEKREGKTNQKNPSDVTDLYADIDRQ